MAVEQAEASEKYTVEHTATSWQQQLQYDHSAEVERAGERERERCAARQRRCTNNAAVLIDAHTCTVLRRKKTEKRQDARRIWSDDCSIQLMESAEASVQLQRCGGRHFLPRCSSCWKRTEELWFYRNDDLPITVM